ncbi:TROVE domain-containing protein [Nonomuraea sp. SMC257]|uniref:TROVE domain-containing protein n=1 Tax=Nonomuraea montanisoli TaxID=2741721 RepID=A0A7Y6M1V5_9ACTN|nr:TROVE domain-containing protein [Nonomuraea montanisoli]NUW30755.1 TROVE domain-containing protein [Nonomuraea montanisoli]
MAKFNGTSTRVAVSSPVKSEETPSGRTHEGAPGYARDARSELFLLAITNMVGENTFYEKAGDRDNRFRALVHQIAIEDGEWLARFLPWLRSGANMRSAPVVAALEAVKARLGAGLHGLNRQLVNSVLQRADEPGEALAYWTSTYGRAIPKPVKRGVADAVQRLYSERSLLKYDTDSKGYRFGDVIDVVHPSPDPGKPWQGDLFAHALDRRHNRDNAIPESLRVLQRRAHLMSIPVAERRAIVENGVRDAVAVTLADAGMTWEALAGWLQGAMDKQAWESVIPTMGLMALTRNLRNFDQAGVSDELAAVVAAKLASAEEVRRSKQFPFRFLAAYKHAPSLRWAYPLEQALGHSLANVPALKGRTLILVDRSGSMFGGVSGKSGLNRADSAAVFGVALAMRAESADLVEFGTRSSSVAFGAGESVLKVVDRFGDLGGTNTAEAVRAHYRGHDRLVIVTDEQAWGGHHGADPTAQVPADVPVYTWNLAGYQYGQGPSGGWNRHTFGGLSDAAFRLIPLLEAGKNADWPF